MSASACGSVLVEPTACRQLGEAACQSRGDCAVGACGSCTGGSSFITCYDPASESGPGCPKIVCPLLCSAMRDEASCKTRTDCRVDSCPGCSGGSAFIRCSAADDPIYVACPAIPCPAPCAVMTSKETCEARPECHSVFVDNRDCQCAALGCCARFSRCADGASAVCKAPAIICDAVSPYCEGPYVVAYAGSCYEGCVQSSDCAPTSEP